MQAPRTTSFVPGYRSLGPRTLHERVERGLESLACCRACPRDCRVDRLEDEWAVCKTGRYAVVSSAFAHFGEEDCLRGWRGSGTLFFSHCNLRCVFCQNYDISQTVKGRDRAGSPPEELAVPPRRSCGKPATWHADSDSTVWTTADPVRCGSGGWACEASVAKRPATSRLPVFRDLTNPKI